VTSFILEARGPQSAVRHVAAPEPFSARRRGLELWNTWWRQSPPQLGGGVWSCGTHGSIRALLSWEVGSIVVGHVAAPEPSSTRRWGLEL
jgi:hypothetical protein